MKLAIFTDTYFPQINGVSFTLGKMREYMDQRDIEYLFFVPEKQPGELFNKTVSFYGINFPLYPELKISFPRYATVTRALDEFRPDLIHLVTEFPICLKGLKYARQRKLPVIASYHTNFTEYLKYYHLQFLENPAGNYLRWFHSRSRMNFCPSTESLQQLSGLGVRNVEVCPHGIDSDIFSPALRSDDLRAQYLSGPDEIMLLYVGRIAPEKDLDVLMKAVQLLNRKAYSFKLLVVGDGPSREGLEKKKFDNVIFCGYKTGQELQRIYSSADIFVFPSTTETFGNVVMEAMASGLPVVAAFAGGVKDNLVDMFNGLAFQPGNAEQMADNIMKLIDNGKLRGELSANAVKYARSRGWDEVFNYFFDRCRAIIDQSRERRA